MYRFRSVLIVLLLGSLVTGCASMDKATKQRQVASLLEYLFPGREQVPPASDKVAEIKVPFRIGVAFVPDNADPEFRLPETNRMKLSGEVSAAFSNYPFISEIVPIPSVYLETGGGFENLERISALLNLDVIALISFDQVQHSGASGWSFLYWTGIGAYVIDGDEYDILSAVETAVIDVKSRRMLMRAGGISHIKGAGTLVGFSEEARKARSQGFDEAIKDMIGKLHGAVKRFRQQAPSDPMIRLILPKDYNPGASSPSPE